MREGDLLQGRFRLDQQIGRGGFARVFRCTDLTLGRQVAIKVLHPELTTQNEEQDFLERFRREARAVAALDHPNILGIHDYGEDAGSIYLVMPFIDGGTVHGRLTGGRTLPLAEAAKYLRQVANALDYAHRRGVVHRDIKPQNMLLRAEDDRLLLADFGIAKVLSDTGAHTLTGAVGTVAYMAPEQFRGQISPALDIYALGCVAFQFLTGQLPFSGSTEQMIFGHLHGPVPSLTERGGTLIPATLQPILEKALQKNPAARYATADDFVSAFEQAIDPASTRQGLPPAASETATRIAPGFDPTIASPATGQRNEQTIMRDTGEAQSHTPLPPLPTPYTGASARPTEVTPLPRSEDPISVTPLPASNTPPPATWFPQTGPTATGEQTSDSAKLNLPPATATKGRNLRLPSLLGAGSVLLLVLLAGLYLSQRPLTVNPTVSSTIAAVVPTATQDTPPASVLPIAFTTPTVMPTATTTISSTQPSAVPTAPPPTPLPSTAPTVAAASPTAVVGTPLAGTTTATFSGHTDHLRGLTWANDGHLLISGSSDGSVRFWQADGTLLNTFSGRTFAVTSVALSPDNTLLAVGADGPTNQAQIWRVDGTLVANLVGHTDNVVMVAWAPNGQILATASSDRTVKLWSPTGQLLRTLSGHTDKVQNVAWAPDSQRLVTAAWDKTLRIWDLQGQVLATLSGHTAPVFGVAWSPDGATIASASEDNSVRLWQPNGTLIATLNGHSAAVSCVAWSPDGRTLASASFDKTIRLWSSTGTSLATLAGHSDAVTALAWQPDGKALASGSWDKTIRIWK